MINSDQLATSGHDYDFVVIGSGFGGSVSALRLTEKGYKVLVLEKGKWYRRPEDFAKSNWNLRRWLWLPFLGMRGIMKLTFFRHLTVVSGVGVGGGSLVYANTLPAPRASFFKSGSWFTLCDWQKELQPYYTLARKMLGVTKNPYINHSDRIMQQLATTIGKSSDCEKTEVGVFFGRPGQEVPDPYFGGAGPRRSGCTQCGACMVGCRENAKNTLDKNYLYLAQRSGCTIMAESKVVQVIPKDVDGSGGYTICYKRTFGFLSKTQKITAKGIIFAGGVLGTVPLLLKLHATTLPHLSAHVGRGIRTNCESLIGVTTPDRTQSFSEGIAIGSIIQLDEFRHLEPVIYPSGSGFWRLFMAPMVEGRNMAVRFIGILKALMTRPLTYLRIYLVDDWSRRTQILLYMETLDSTLRLRRSFGGRIKSATDQGIPPTAFNPLAHQLARKVEHITGGQAMVMATESLLGIPTTAHILGGACMGVDAATGVIDSKNRVFGYQNMLVCDGSMISANPGVNPSLTITALTERAMDYVPSKGVTAIATNKK